MGFVDGGGWPSSLVRTLRKAAGGLATAPLSLQKLPIKKDLAFLQRELVIHVLMVPPKIAGIIFFDKRVKILCKNENRKFYLYFKCFAQLS